MFKQPSSPDERAPILETTKIMISKFEMELGGRVLELETGAWYDPLDPTDPTTLEVHGNPNALTRDAGTSKLAQGPSAHSCLVEVEKFTGELPEIRVFSQPAVSNHLRKQE